MLETVKADMQKWASNTTRWNQQALSKPVNEFSFKIDIDTDGALRNQVYLLGILLCPLLITVLNWILIWMVQSIL